MWLMAAALRNLTQSNQQSTSKYDSFPTQSPQTNPLLTEQLLSSAIYPPATNPFYTSLLANQQTRQKASSSSNSSSSSSSSSSSYIQIPQNHQSSGSSNSPSSLLITSNHQQQQQQQQQHQKIPSLTPHNTEPSSAFDLYMYVKNMYQNQDQSLIQQLTAASPSSPSTSSQSSQNSSTSSNFLNGSSFQSKASSYCLNHNTQGSKSPKSVTAKSMAYYNSNNSVSPDQFLIPPNLLMSAMQKNSN